MKRLFFIVALVLVMTSIAFAKPPAGPAGPVGPQGEIGPQGPAGVDGINGTNGSDAVCEDRDTPIGVGADILVFQTKDKNVGFEAQYRYDLNNDESSLFGVVKVNLWEKLQKKDQAQ